MGFGRILGELRQPLSDILLAEIRVLDESPRARGVVMFGLGLGVLTTLPASAPVGATGAAAFKAFEIAVTVVVGTGSTVAAGIQVASGDPSIDQVYGPVAHPLEESVKQLLGKMGYILPGVRASNEGYKLIKGHKDEQVRAFLSLLQELLVHLYEPSHSAEHTNEPHAKESTKHAFESKDERGFTIA